MDELRYDPEFRAAIVGAIHPDRSPSDILTDLCGARQGPPGPLQRAEVLARIPLVQQLLDCVLAHADACEDIHCKECLRLPSAWLEALNDRRMQLRQERHPSTDDSA